MALGLFLFRGWPFPNNILQMVLLQKPYLYYGIKDDCVPRSTLGVPRSVPALT
jgi:hypothetical protein